MRRSTRHSPNRYTVERRRGVTLELYLTPVYILGVADCAVLRMQFPCVNAIVLASQWNSASDDVYEKGIEDGVGLYGHERPDGRAEHRE